MTTRLRAVLFVAAAACSPLAGCGGGELVCEPECPAGSRCTESGCVFGDAGVRDLATPPSGDLAGTCTPSCGGGAPYCVAGVCVACVDDSNCADGQICKKIGSTATCVPGCSDDARCRAGGNAAMACCGGGCADTSKDPANCGGCGKACAAANAATSCQAGACVTGACNAGWGDCNHKPDDGCETNVRADARNCGACGSACAIDHAIAGCSDGCYIAACEFGWDDCDEKQEGCETSVLSDVQNCGACGAACPGAPHASSMCVNATCQLKQCDPGYTDCDGNAGNGCETVVDSDPKNCGACGNACPQGLVCINSSCTCPLCKIPNAQSKCVNNVCTFDKCLPGFTDCDGNPANGCEAATATDPANCGGCGNVCPPNLPGCAGGVCINGWFPVGVQQNVPVKMLAGWSECFRDTYADAGTPLAQILGKCSGSKLMMACGRAGDKSTLVLAAWAPRADVTFATGGAGVCPSNAVHQANGVGWYYDSDWSWGFVKGGDAPENCSCDVAGNNAQYRMCWHTSGGDIQDGYRCGADDGLNGDNSWERIVYQFQ